MKANYTNNDYNRATVKVKGEQMRLADFIALDVENCPICGTDELDFWDCQPHMSNAMHTAAYECPNCRRLYTWEGTGSEKGEGRHLLAAVKKAKKNWNEWAKAMRKDKTKLAQIEQMRKAIKGEQGL